MRPVVFICLLCLFASCGRSKTEVLPGRLTADSVFTRDEMIRILADVHVVEASLNFQRGRGGNTTVLTQNYYRWLCRKYHMSQRRFRENLNYYKMNPENFSKMYQEVLKSLSDRVKKPGSPSGK